MWLGLGGCSFFMGRRNDDAVVLVADLLCYRPRHERITKEEVQAVIESYKRMKWWP